MDNRTCSVDGCERALHAKGYCKLHDQRMRLKGETGGPVLDTRGQRFWAKVNKSKSCWEWTGAKSLTGYGRFRNYGNGSSQAHRIAYEMVVGTIPSGMHLDHKCHNVSCVRPSHLRPVTNKQNQEHRDGAQSNSTSGVLGVSWKSREKKWQVAVKHNGHNVYGGVFGNLEDAERRVIELRLSLFTHNDHDRIPA